MKMEPKDMATKETGTKEMGPNRRSEEIKRRGRLWAPQDCEIFPSVQWTPQAWTRVATGSIPQGAKTGAEGAGECAGSYRCTQL